MTTTIHTSSKIYFNRIQKYLANKRVFFTPSINIEDFVITFFDLNEVETTSLISKMTATSISLTSSRSPLLLLPKRSTMAIVLVLLFLIALI